MKGDFSVSFSFLSLFYTFRHTDVSQNDMKNIHINGNYQMKTLCRETKHGSSAAADTAEVACVNNCEQQLGDADALQR